ncbi:MAG: FtsX-like permease family protein, partial [Anaeroplasmataceae bacterium]|nr:FtsX-like permease family protein [Anaeroplasmataceae bacterium]
YESSKLPMSPFKYHADMSELNSNEGEELVVKAILKPKEGISYGCMTSGFFYTQAFTQKFISDGLSSEIVKYLNEHEEESFSSMIYKDPTSGMSIPMGITYTYTYQAPDGSIHDATGFVGDTNAMMDLIGGMMPEMGIQSAYTLSLRALGGKDIANSISIYPVNFELKDGVTSHLDKWNSDEDITFTKLDGTVKTIRRVDRDNITYSDNIAVVIDMINSLINLVTTALISFTALSLVVSCFMIAIITYVSVVERVKEIGVIRSLGGRKKDVTHLFNAETFIIGLISGVFGIAVTYLISLILNIIVNSITGVYPIASLPIWQAAVMILVSILLTVVSGLIPARSAAKKDPVVALRTE